MEYTRDGQIVETLDVETGDDGNPIVTSEILDTLLVFAGYHAGGPQDEDAPEPRGEMQDE